MPIYEYQCQECGHQMDALQRISEEPLSECPSCARPALRKLVSAPRFRLKGSGWYETDFKTGNKKNLAGDQEPKKNGDGKKDKEDTAAKPDPTASKTETAKKDKPGSKAD
ncbi:MAG: zinc ribbon domain-containing protein [Gammaproteobacteria bacterium]|nr:zinc ribbon domain-containing protein [Gammaproteobacteria bacterium]